MAQETKLETLRIRCSKSFKARVSRLAKRHKRTPSDMTRIALDQMFEAEARKDRAQAQPEPAEVGA